MVRYRNPKMERENVIGKSIIKFNYDKVADGIYEVKGSDQDSYRVDVVNGTCTCKGWYFNNPPEGVLKSCKHLKYFKEVDQIEKKGKLRESDSDK